MSKVWGLGGENCILCTMRALAPEFHTVGKCLYWVCFGKNLHELGRVYIHEL